MQDMMQDDCGGILRKHDEQWEWRNASCRAVA
jgi:hypothetical protein